jgi:hypothetical protein
MLKKDIEPERRAEQPIRNTEPAKQKGKATASIGRYRLPKNFRLDRLGSGADLEASPRSLLPAVDFWKPKHPMICLKVFPNRLYPKFRSALE